MITLTVVAFNDTPVDGTLQAHFDELGGSIGRADTNQLVLPDPERMVSRVAAQVVYRNGSFVIVDRGSNPISLNGQALSSGREAPLASGDRLNICGYELSVRVGGGEAPAARDPFSSLLGPAPTARAGGARFGSTPDPGAARFIDPLHKPAPAPPKPPLPTTGGIPADWDLYEESPPKPGASPAPPGPPRQNALGLDLGAAAPAPLVGGLEDPAAGPSSLDRVFGLVDSSGGDPLAGSALDAPMAQPNLSADADPLRSLNSAPKATAPSESDQLSDLRRPFIAPPMLRPGAPATPPPRKAPIPSADTSPPFGAPPASGAVMSWEMEDGEMLPGSRSPPPALSHPGRMAPAAAAMSAHPAAVSASDGSSALLEAFRRGLDAPSLQLPALTPAVMELLGQLLHEAVRGTLDLLNARATLKHELRADVTTIVARNNNPLKFSPNAEVALQHLLAPPARGFMAATPAMRDAYDDLRIHQFSFVAGMQSVLEAALQRFDPAVLEAQLGEPHMLHNVLPAMRNAKLWEMFTEHFGRIRADAGNDFHSLFGPAFLLAYAEHVKRLQQQRDAERPDG